MQQTRPEETVLDLHGRECDKNDVLMVSLITVFMLVKTKQTREGPIKIEIINTLKNIASVAVRALTTEVTTARHLRPPTRAQPSAS